MGTATPEAKGAEAERQKPLAERKKPEAKVALVSEQCQNSVDTVSSSHDAQLRESLLLSRLVLCCLLTIRV
jgi:hypothetical protein